MKIGILEAGLLNEAVADRFDAYPLMFAGLLARAEKNFEYQTFSVVRNRFPASVEECDGWLITGSRHGVYENLDWILQLEALVRDIYRAGRPLVGICFGHQVVARALGGEVVKSDRGWGVGVSSYSVDRTLPWMKQPVSQIRINAFHQDQVVQLPADAEVFLSSDFCPYAGLTYGDSAISIQAHPEFEEEYERALLEMYSGNVVPEADAKKALAGMAVNGAGADTQLLAEWIAGFFNSHRK